MLQQTHIQISPACWRMMPVQLTVEHMVDCASSSCLINSSHIINTNSIMTGILTMDARRSKCCCNSVGCAYMAFITGVTPGWAEDCGSLFWRSTNPNPKLAPTLLTITLLMLDPLTLTILTLNLTLTFGIPDLPNSGPVPGRVPQKSILGITEAGISQTICPSYHETDGVKALKNSKNCPQPGNNLPLHSTFLDPSTASWIHHNPFILILK